jgi:hypothetical protein
MLATRAANVGQRGLSYLVLGDSLALCDVVHLDLLALAYLDVNVVDLALFDVVHLGFLALAYLDVDVGRKLRELHAGSVDVDDSLKSPVVTAVEAIYGIFGDWVENG